MSHNLVFLCANSHFHLYLWRNIWKHCMFWFGDDLWQKNCRPTFRCRPRSSYVLQQIVSSICNPTANITGHLGVLKPFKSLIESDWESSVAWSVYQYIGSFDTVKGAQHWGKWFFGFQRSPRARTLWTYKGAADSRNVHNLFAPFWALAQFGSSPITFTMRSFCAFSAFVFFLFLLFCN